MKQRVRAILITPDNTMLLMKRIRPGSAPYWVIIGGGVEASDATLVETGPRASRAASMDVVGRPPPVRHCFRAMAADHGGRNRTAEDQRDPGHPVSLPRQHDSQPLDQHDNLTAETVESPLRREAHGGFGERSGGTDQEQSRNRAPGQLSDEAGVSMTPHPARTWGHTHVGVRSQNFLDGLSSTAPCSTLLDMLTL